MIAVFIAASLAVVALCYVLVGMSAMFYAPLSELFGQFPYHVRTDKKVFALTFDDGPNPPYTDELLAVLKKHGVRATFFLVGKNLERYPEVGRRMAADGHCIGNHTYSHAFSTNYSRKAFVREVERTQTIITTVTGTAPTLCRPPWLFRYPWILNVLKSHKLTAVSAVFGYEFEIVHQRTDAIVRRALQKVKPGVILDFHDGYEAKGGYRQRTVEAIDKLIPELKSRGYSFATVPELLQRARETSRGTF